LNPLWATKLLQWENLLNWASSQGRLSPNPRTFWAAQPYGHDDIRIVAMYLTIQPSRGAKEKRDKDKNMNAGRNTDSASEAISLNCSLN
jgi:hypothetical protein